MSDLTYRPMSNWELQRWDEIVALCCTATKSIELGVEAKPIILAVQRDLEHIKQERNRLCQKLNETESYLAMVQRGDNLRRHELEGMKLKLEQAETALRFYADQQNWQKGPRRHHVNQSMEISEAEYEAGARARTALNT